MEYNEFIEKQLPRLFPPPATPVSEEIRYICRSLSEENMLTPEQAGMAMEIMIGGNCAAYESALFLTALRPACCTPEALAAMARVMRSKALRVTPRLSGEGLLGDNCGTGGDNLGLFNVSTGAMFILAACGVGVAKHGNRASTSRCGSADVLEKLGVKIDLGPVEVARCIEQIGIGFMFAPRYHPAMKHVAEVRRKLPFRTVFNLLGPLCNPAPIRFQLLGVYHPDILLLAGRALMLLDVRRALVVCGEAGGAGEWMDEVSLGGRTDAVLIGGAAFTREKIDPITLSLQPCAIGTLMGGPPEHNASILINILSGSDRGPRRDICLINAAAGLYASGVVADVAEGVARAREALESGRAREKLEKLIQITNTKS